MGVPGLWDLLRPAATRSSLSALAKTAYQTNRHGLRALTIGIDASLWVFHAQVPTAGENPFLRTIWYKLCVLLQQPVLPVFVFDGPHKPGSKRGNRVGGAFGTSDRHSLLFKALLNDCGLEWWNAPGEAEAELAVMNRQGKIDAVLSDDVDALLFGATCLLRNNSATLSGTAHVASSKGDLKTYEIYRSSSIAEVWTAKEGTALKTEEDCRMAMVFVALLSGGDYVPEGLGSFGSITAFALANAGMADQLPLFISSPKRFTDSAPGVQARMIDELRTNSTRHASRKNPAKAKTLSEMSPSDLFPLSSLQSYLQPATSPLNDLSAGWPGFGLGGPSLTRGKARIGGRGDLEGLSKACEKYFEWGTRDLVCKKFAGESTGVFGADIMAAARNRRLELDKAEKASTAGGGGGGASVQGRMTSFFGASTAVASSSRSKGTGTAQRSPTPGTSATPSYILKIERTRPDPTWPGLTEYRLLYETKGFIERVHASMEGHRIDPKYLSAEKREELGLVAIPAEEDDGDGAPSASQAKADPMAKGQARVWMADWLVKDAWPSLVEEWEQKQAAKNANGMGKGRIKSGGTTTPKKKAPAKAPAGGKGKKKAVAEVDDGDLGSFFGGTQARVASPVPAAPVRTTTRSGSPPARTHAAAKPPAKAGPSRQPSGSTSARSMSAAGPSRPRINAGEVITIDDSDDEPPEPVEPKRKAIDLSSTPTPPRRTTSRTKKAATRTSSRLPTLSTSPPPAAGPSRPRAKKVPSGNSQVQPIMIISSDEDESPRTRTVSPPDSLERLITRRTGRSILSPSSRQNTSSPSTRSSPRLAAKSMRAASPLHPPPKRTHGQAQMNLGLPIVASSSTSRSSPKATSAGPSTPRSASPAPVPSLSPSKSRTAARSSPSPVAPDQAKKGRTKPRRSYVVLVDGGEEGGGVIDCTRGGRILKDTGRY